MAWWAQLKRYRPDEGFRTGNHVSQHGYEFHAGGCTREHQFSNAVQIKPEEIEFYRNFRNSGRERQRAFDVYEADSPRAPEAAELPAGGPVTTETLRPMSKALKEKDTQIGDLNLALKEAVDRIRDLELKINGPIAAESARSEAGKTQVLPPTPEQTMAALQAQVTEIAARVDAQRLQNLGPLLSPTSMPSAPPVATVPPATPRRRRGVSDPPASTS